MLPYGGIFDELQDRFEWNIPEYYNIGVDVCDKWADREPDRLALVSVETDGNVTEYNYEDLKKLSNQLANLLTDTGIQ